MKNNPWHLSFSIGPVQTFVAQSRRTRDFWSASWLLSNLAENALAEAEIHGGNAVIPHRSKKARGQVSTSSIGGIPNRFELSFNSEQAAVDAGNKASAAFAAAWHKIAHKTWETYLHQYASTITQEIWTRQVQNFWEVSWVAGPAESIGAMAAARKQFRNVKARPESGVKCSLMPDYQELSGTTSRRAMDNFWSGLALELNLRPTERLCAIALIKRLLPDVSKKAIEVDLQSRSWPSTAFMAALPWLKQLEGEHLQKAMDYAQQCGKTEIKNSELTAAKVSQLPWASIDGPAWFASALDKNEWGINPDTKSALSATLNALNKSENAGRPSPYYALLIMDGDRMGKLLQQLGSATKLSEYLNEFTGCVDDIVTRHDGKTIYAGGDDVLAIVPATHALKTATELSQKYSQTFQHNKQPIAAATLSGAIVYAHWAYPLRQVLQHAHRLLDDIAKNQTGRDALAIGIIQGSGLNALWSAPWRVVRGEEKSYAALHEIIEQFSNDDTDHETTKFNASFLYHLREQFSRLLDPPPDKPGSFGYLPVSTSAASPYPSGLLADLANAEFRRRLPKEQRQSETTEVSLATLLPLMQLSRKTTNNDGHTSATEHSFGFDGWRVARFLKQLQSGKAFDND